MGSMNWNRYIEDRHVKDKILLCDLKYVIVFELNIMAPISKAFDYIEDQREAWGTFIDEEGIDNIISVIYHHNIVPFEYCIKNNTAGANGECITWDQMVELYKG